MGKIKILYIGISNKSPKNVTKVKYLEISVINQRYIHEQVSIANSIWGGLNYTSL